MQGSIFWSYLGMANMSFPDLFINGVAMYQAPAIVLNEWCLFMLPLLWMNPAAYACLLISDMVQLKFDFWVGTEIIYEIGYEIG